VTDVLALSPSEIDIRTAWPEDQAWVASTFREQLVRGQPAASYASVDRIVDRVLDSSRTHVLMATRGRRLIGWLAYVEMPRVRALLFCYVRKDDRGAGVARMLADQAWPRRAGQWVHAGLRGGTTAKLLERHRDALEMDLGELL